MYGGIVGFTAERTGSAYTIAFCINSAAVKGNNYVGGIAGAGWSTTGDSVGIMDCYNIGNVTASSSIVGGLIGGTYYNYSGKTVSTANYVHCSYNLGAVSGSKVNQIAGGYAHCNTAYYISGRINANSYGVGKSVELFKAEQSNTNSVIYGLNSNKTYWKMDTSNINNGYPILLDCRY